MSQGVSSENLVSSEIMTERELSWSNATRRHRAYLTRRRHELLGTVRAIVEFAEILRADPEIGRAPQMAGDLDTIRANAIRSEQLIESALSPALIATESAAKILNHDLRGVLAILINYAGELHRSCSKAQLHDLIREVDEIRSLSRRALALVDSTVMQLRDSDGLLHTEDIQSYLDRAAWPTDGRCEGADDAPSAEPGLILVADDSQPIRDLLCKLLRQQGHEVVAATDGLAAIALLRARTFDLVLTDLEMPGANGFEVIEHLKANPLTRDTPIVVISGHGELDGIAHCIKRGAEDYLPKPFNRTILKARVDTCLEKKRLRDRHEVQLRRYDELLHAILPGPIVAELALTNAVRPRRREEVAVLFADVVGFTTYCDRLQDRPEVVVHHLRQLFETWEEILGRSGVQKIKTIGDALMGAAGLLEDAENPVLNCVDAGLEMIRATQALVDDDGQPLGLNLRVGIEIGPVVAGVLGRKQSLYDLWGDTVNVAARIESHGQPGCVNLGPAAWPRVSGLLQTKGVSTCILKGKPDPIDVVHLCPLTARSTGNG
jgi:adenylate cyclase